MRRSVLAAAILWAVGGLLTPQAQALGPSEVMVLYTTKSARSLQVAKHYVKVREIPEQNLIALNCTAGENISEVEYRTSVVPQVQKALAANPAIKCIVTTYDVPLRMNGVQLSAAEKKEVVALTEQLDALLADIDRSVTAYETLAGGTPTTQTADPPVPPAKDKKTLQGLLPKLQNAGRGAAERIAKLPEDQRTAPVTEMLKLQEQVAGLSGLLSGFKIKEGVPGAQAGYAHMEKLQTQLRETESKIHELMKDRHNPAARKQIIDLRKTTHGLAGQAHQIENFLALMQPPETESCFDNELAMVVAEQDYSRARWVSNPKNIAVYDQVQRMRKVPQAILVARVDNATVPDTIRMIDIGVEVEKKGLDGKMYLDARGIKEGAYSVMDVMLRELAAWMKDNSTMEFSLDDKEPLIEAKDCPNAALYCGWYSLHTYRDSCQWVKGGVGYHVASHEMLSLHGPNHVPGQPPPPPETGWVVNLLKRGYCGTMGATAEPYLASFSNPAHFFPLLMCGEFTQGEVWEVTAPMLSWRTGYVGDPLYNPFKAKPRVKLEAIKAHPIMKHAFTILRPERKAEGAPAAPNDSAKTAVTPGQGG
jgi:uncharacterized protein (TIGR03790 family)